MKGIFYIFMFVGVLLSCSSNTNKTSSNSVSNRDINNLKNEKELIEKLFNAKIENVEILVKLKETGEIVNVNDSDFSEPAESTFNILRDNSDNIVLILELPVSESGDWSIIYANYFDKNGKIFAFERKTNFFNSHCTDGVAYETITKFYNNNFVVVDSTYKLVDQNDNLLNRDSCQFPYDYDYKIAKTVYKYLNDKKIKNSR